MALHNGDADAGVMNDINMTPLIDVMLVLLIVFMITLPVIHHAVKLELPKATSAPDPHPQAPVVVDISADGSVSWNGELMNEQALAAKIEGAAALSEPPVLQLYADRHTQYESIAIVLAAAQSHGLAKIHFVTEPRS